MTVAIAVPLDEVTFEPLRFELRRKVANSKASWTSREGTVVRVCAGGAVGYGEASPLPGFSAESLTDVSRDLDRARDVLRSTVLPLEGDAEKALEHVFAELGLFVPSARFAVETAVLDLRARLRGEPLWRQLGGTAAVDPVSISALLVGDDPAEIATAVRDALARGIHTGKLKVGRPGAMAAELDAAVAARRAGGAAFRLRLDANGAWKTDEAQAALAAFASVDPELVEEPVGGDDWLAMGRSPVPVALDESGVGVEGARRFATLIQDRRCDALVIKLSIAGGFLAGAAMARHAAKANVPLIVTHMFEGPIATAAAAAFALAYGSRTHAAGLDVRAYIDLPDDHPIGVARIDPFRGPGLGMRAR